MKKGHWEDTLGEFFDEKRPYTFAIIIAGQIDCLEGKFTSFEEAISQVKKKAKNYENIESVGYIVCNSRVLLENLLKEYNFRPHTNLPFDPEDRNIID